MPQCDAFCSHDIQLDFAPVFQAIQDALSAHDSSTGVCKSRAFISDQSSHSNIAFRIALMQKPHRDKPFMLQCLNNLEAAIKPHLPDGIYYSVEVVFLSEHYLSLKK